MAREQTPPPSSARLADWIGGARPRTLTLGVAPVVLGTGAAHLAGRMDLATASLCLATAVFLQVGVNFSNDYSDGVRGTDDHRVGPPRLTGSGSARPGAVLATALASYSLAAVAGIVLAVVTDLWWLVLVGGAAIIAAWFYTGGRRPYGYRGLGEVFVFLFFGPVAVLGTELVQAGTITLVGVASGVAAGSAACAVLMVNNIRDVGPDAAAGKRTLAVIAGRGGSRALFVVFLLLPYLVLVALIPAVPSAAIALIALTLAVPAAVTGVRAPTAAGLIGALQRSSFAALAYAVLLAIGFALA